MDKATIYCPHCGRKLKCPSTVFGRRVKCLSCAESFLAPREEEDIFELESEETSPAASKTAAHDPADVLGDLARSEELADSQSQGFTCPDCKATLPQGARICVQCGFDLETGRRLQRSVDNTQAAKTEKEPIRRLTMSDDDEGGGATGWIVFILIFGVGNWILYETTGWFILPIPRR